MGRSTGDKTGVFYIVDNTRVYIETHSIRTEAPVNYDVQPDGELIFPILTVVTGTRSPALSVAGRIQGIEELRVFKNVHSILTDKGSSSCFDCSGNSQALSHYWFGKVKVMLGGQFEVLSDSRDIATRSVVLHISRMDLDYTGSVRADTVEMFSDFFSVEFDAKADGTGRGWPPGQGPGANTACEKVVGAGHGGAGGWGQISGCNRNCKPSSGKFGSPCIGMF